MSDFDIGPEAVNFKVGNMYETDRHGRFVKVQGWRWVRWRIGWLWRRYLSWRWHPREVITCVDVEGGTITVAIERWSWRRWRWERDEAPP